MCAPTLSFREREVGDRIFVQQASLKQRGYLDTISGYWFAHFSFFYVSGCGCQLGGSYRSEGKGRWHNVDIMCMSVLELATYFSLHFCLSVLSLSYAYSGGQRAERRNRSPRSGRKSRQRCKWLAFDVKLKHALYLCPTLSTLYIQHASRSPPSDMLVYFSVSLQECIQKIMNDCVIYHIHTMHIFSF